MATDAEFVIQKPLEQLGWRLTVPPRHGPGSDRGPKGRAQGAALLEAHQEPRGRYSTIPEPTQVT